MRQLAALALLVCAAPALGSEQLAARLLDHLAALDSGQMEFDQALTDSRGRVARSFGELSFARPDRFKVVYRSPDRLKLISNGETFWFHDVELNQVVAASAATAQGSKGMLTVLASSDLASLFAISGRQDAGSGIAWLVLKPHDPAAVELVHCEVGFDASGTLVEVVLEDLLGNYISARFSALRPLADPARHFDFEPPDGAEIIQQ